MKSSTKRRLILIDLETTGLNKFLDQMIEISCFKINGNAEIEEEAYHVLMPDVGVAKGAHMTHGYTMELLENSPKFEEVAPQLEKFFSCKHVVVAHNISFDATILNLAFKRAGYAFQIKNEDMFDTYTFVKKNFCFENYRLDTVAKSLKVFDEKTLAEMRITHSARNDNLILLGIMGKLLANPKFKKHAILKGWDFV